MKTMKTIYSFLFTFCFALAFIVLVPRNATAQFSTLTNETRVNTTTAGDQNCYWWSVRTIAVQPDGGYIIVWIDAGGNDGQGNGIYGQLFNASGAKVGSEFLVNTTTTGDQYSPSVAVAPDGSFIVAWEGPGTSIDVFAQRFTKNGVKTGPEFLLNTGVNGNQRYPELQYYLDGTFLAAFVDASGGQTVLQRFDANGRTIGQETRVTSASGAVVMDHLCVRPDNSVLITWTTSAEVYGQLFDSNLNPIGTQKQLNTYTTGTQEYCNGAVDANGNFVVVWESAGEDGSGNGIYGRRYDKNFNPLSGEFAITTNKTNDQFEPQIAMEPGGRFIIAWSDNNNRDGGGSAGGNSGTSIWFREFDVNGNAVGSETMVNQSVTGYQAYPVIDINASGRFVISWEGNGTQAGQIDSYGIFARAYQLSQTGTTAISVSPSAVTASDLVTVTMTLTAPLITPNVYPNSLAVSGTNGVFATLVSGPTPSSAIVSIVPVTFSWTYKVTAKDKSGQLTFSGNAHSGGGAIFPYAISNSITVTPSVYISDLTGPNLIDDSNNPTSGPQVFTIGAKVTNLSLNTLTNVKINLGDGVTGGTFPITTMALTQTNNTYHGSFALVPMAGSGDCIRSLTDLGPARALIAGGIDFNGDGVVNGSDDGTLSNGKKVIDGRVDVNLDGIVNASDDLSRPAGVFDGYREPSIIDGYVDSDGNGIINASDNATYGGETKNIYWQVRYDVVDAFGKPTFGDCNDFTDDLRYNWVLWATCKEAGVDRTSVTNEFAKVRCELSASANKITPTGNPTGYISGGPPHVLGGLVDINSDNQITSADDGTYYGKTVIDGKVDMNGSGTITTADDGYLNGFPVIDGLIDVNGNGSISIADDAILVQPGMTFTVTVHNATFGNVGNGFDENRDNLSDFDIWYQPIGKTNWPAASFRLVDIQTDVTGSGGSNPLNGITTHYDNEPYLSRLIGDVSGAFIATYTYTFVVVNPGNGFLTPYQEAASGNDNEKYNGDYGSGVNILTWYDVPLPLTGLGVSARLNGSTAVVDWKTESELNSDYFIIERSIDNANFAAIGNKIKAAGNSSTRKNYQLSDDISSLRQYDKVYYRVKQVDIDNKSTYSSVVLVKLNKSATFTTMPNPFLSSIAVNFNSTTTTIVTLNLMNSAGLTIRTFNQPVEKGVNQIALNDLDRLSAGMYLLEVIDKSTGSRISQKLIKNN